MVGTRRRWSDLVGNRKHGAWTRIQPNKSIREDLRADTIACIKIVVALENEFDIKIPDEQWERLYTVQHIIDYVYNRLGE